MPTGFGHVLPDQNGWSRSLHSFLSYAGTGWVHGGAFGTGLAGRIQGVGATGLTAAARLSAKYVLLPRDHAGLCGAGTTLQYAAQGLLTRHTMAREFPRQAISKVQFVDGPTSQDAPFLKLKAAAEADWRLEVDGMVSRPLSLGLADIRALPKGQQIAHPACEEGMNGWPLCMRVPRQLGYTSVCYITRLTVTDDLKRFGKGLGSASPEFGYSWYAGI